MGIPEYPFVVGCFFFIHIEAGCRFLSTQQPNETNLPTNQSINQPSFINRTP
jgi:hypothetical protein